VSATVPPVENDELTAALRGWPALVGVELLVLHGSRARGDAGPTSDWDLGYLPDPGADVDPAALLDLLASALGTDAVDLVDLRRASALLRFRAARDGVALIETRPEAFLDFRLEAVRFWCDAEPVIRAAQAEVLASLG
jgi:predicted nucleotidyltransferase